MKKLLLFVTLLVYFLVSTGFVVSIHFCMDRIHSFQLGDRQQENCGACGMPLQDNKGCCKDKVKVVKLQVDQVTAKAIQPTVQVRVLYSTLTPLSFLLPVERQNGKQETSHAPPINRQNSYLHHCVFRI